MQTFFRFCVKRFFFPEKIFVFENKVIRIAIAVGFFWVNAPTDPNTSSWSWQVLELYLYL